MIGPDALLDIAVVELALLLATVGLLIGHASWLGIRRGPRERARAQATVSLAGAIDGPAENLRPVGKLSTSAQLAVFSEAMSQLRGDARESLGSAATEVGLTRKAERWCRSRRWWKRLRGARALTVLGGGEDVVPRLLDDPRADVRAQAVQWVVDHPAPDHVTKLVDMLDSPDELCRFTVHDALVRLGGAAADPLLDHITRPGGTPAPAALEIAAGLADPRFLEPALDLCRAEDPWLRVRAARVVAALGGTRANEALAALLDDPDADVRAAACEGLGRLGDWQSAATLAERMRDPAWEVRKAAALALRGLGAPGMLLLRRAESDRDRFARDMARHVLEIPEGFA